jgi:peptidyl-prolyl cis-trans isomerase C
VIRDWKEKKIFSKSENLRKKLYFYVLVSHPSKEKYGKPVKNNLMKLQIDMKFFFSPLRQLFYPSTPPFLYMASQARASHILVKTEDEANKILKRINDGEDFTAVAKRFSSCPSRKNGGDLGWFGKGQMVPEFEKVAFENDPGKIVGPIKTQFGYHIIKVTGRK